MAKKKMFIVRFPEIKEMELKIIAASKAAAAEEACMVMEEKVGDVCSVEEVVDA